ncbi:MAG: dienelactone hydrolase family protein [Armatimonadetes bacterium]|nr:dienelactone hydrolase family protein [Armatimonadota bacterium]
MPDYSVLSMLQRRMREALAKREPFPKDKEKLLKRLARTREALMECLGTMPPKITQLNVRKEAEFLLAGTEVIQERIVYRTEEDVWVPAHIYRPIKTSDEKLPGILLIQGWDLDKHSLPEFKVKLASAGYVVLFPDNRFSGERKRARTGQAEQCNFLPVAGLFGLTFIGMNTWDNMRALDVLSLRPDVDDEKIGVVGLCWGGMQAWTLAAIDERVKAVCPVCSVSTYEALLQDYIPWTDGHTCFGVYIWNWAKYGDIQDIIACIAPRPLLIQNNVNDTWFPISGFYKVVQEVAEVYRTLGAEENFRYEARITEHDITKEFGDNVISWFDKHLKSTE